MDWDVRFSNMQQHSGEHIVSGLVHRLYGLDNVGFHMGSDAVTVDFNGVLTDAQLEEIESLANEAVVQNVSVTVAYPDAAELASMPYRKMCIRDSRLFIRAEYLLLLDVFQKPFIIIPHS